MCPYDLCIRVSLCLVCVGAEGSNEKNTKGKKLFPTDYDKKPACTLGRCTTARPTLNDSQTQNVSESKSGLESDGGDSNRRSRWNSVWIIMLPHGKSRSLFSKYSSGLSIRLCPQTAAVLCAVFVFAKLAETHKHNLFVCKSETHSVCATARIWLLLEKLQRPS